MISQEKNETVSNILSDAAQKSYEKIKALILRIFTLLKRQKNQKNLKEEFYDSYIDFARKLKSEGYDNECYNYMAICEMYYHLMDRPDELISHEKFFNDLFNAFDDLLSSRISKSVAYDEKYDEFLLYTTKMQEYYYKNLAVPSMSYDEEVCNKIICRLSGDF